MDNNIDSNQYKQQEAKTITIQTHDKRFHADDVGAVSLLTSYYNQKETKVHLIRSRNKGLLDTSDVVVDVGGIYDSTNHRYDHHQADCDETFSDSCKIPMSSIGMVWKHYGQELLQLYIQSQADFNVIEGWTDHIESLHNDVYIKIIQEIDAHDNGVSMIDGGKRNFWSNMYLSSIISSMNTPDTNNEEEQMTAFEEAVGLFGQIFEIKLKELVRKYFDYQISHKIVQQYLTESPTSEYLIITEKIITIYKCLNVLDPAYRIKFIIFNLPDENEITIRTRSRRDDIYTPIVPLLPNNILKERLGEYHSDIIFVHKALFIAKTTTIEAAIGIVGHSLMEHTPVNESVPRSYLNVLSPRRRGWLVVGVTLGGLILSGTLLYKSSDFSE